jgi:hypothetical protein
MLQFRNPAWGDAAHTYINMEIKLDTAVRKHWIDMEGEWIEFSANPNDTEDYGVWLYDAALAKGGIAEYVPPSLEDQRANMPSITKRQLRLTLVRNGIPLGQVIAAIAGMEEGLAKEEAAIEWDAATEFTRLNPVLLNIAAALSLPPESVDTMWEQALAA